MLFWKISYIWKTHVCNIWSGWILIMNLIFPLECQDLIAQCLRIEPSQRILLEDILRHPWMRQDASSSELPASTNLVMTSSVTSNQGCENQHKPSLNSVGSCVSSSTDECESSPQHCYKKPHIQTRLRPPNSAPQTTSITKATWIAQPIWHEANDTGKSEVMILRERRRAGCYDLERNSSTTTKASMVSEENSWL